jgi:thiamine pyrophosphokinase
MSSHHIVRDEQEPAIIIADIQNEYWSAIDQLLGWVPTVIVDEDCIEEVLLRGIKIDVAVCKPSNLLSIQQQLLDQHPVIILSKIDGDTISTSIDYLTKKGYHGVNIFRAFDLEKSLLANQQINSIWYDLKHRYVMSKKRAFKKWIVAHQTFCLLSTTPDQGYIVSNAKEISPQSYQSLKDGVITVDSNADFWIGEPY